LTAIGALKSGKKGFDRSVDRSVELGFDFCFNKTLMGGGFLAEGRRQKAARIAVIAGIARDRKGKTAQLYAILGWPGMRWEEQEGVARSLGLPVLALFG
jgi:hypothetical protein